MVKRYAFSCKDPRVTLDLTQAGGESLTWMFPSCPTVHTAQPHRERGRDGAQIQYWVLRVPCGNIVLGAVSSSKQIREAPAREEFFSLNVKVFKMFKCLKYE